MNHKIFYTSDLHLNHANIIKHCSRPFKDVDTMNEQIVLNWNSVVSAQDDCYILGDVCFAKSEAEVNKIVQLLNRMNGNKYLITGNHDRFALKFANFRKCFTKIDNYLEITDGNKKVVLFHYPMCEWNGFYRNSIHLYGHVHIDTNSNVPKLENRFNAGVDVNNYTPVTLEQLLEK